MEGEPPVPPAPWSIKKEGDSIRKGQISIKKKTHRQQDGDMEMEGDPRPTCAMEHKKKRGTA